jgi:hypothetical protein
MDPAPYVPKETTITYSANGQRKQPRAVKIDKTKVVQRRYIRRRGRNQSGTRFARGARSWRQNNVETKSSTARHSRAGLALQMIFSKHTDVQEWRGQEQAGGLGGKKRTTDFTDSTDGLSVEIRDIRGSLQLSNTEDESPRNTPTFRNGTAKTFLSCSSAVPAGRAEHYPRSTKHLPKTF